MPNILKRPMFRKGGSASDGVGITSGLSSRQNYQVGRLAIDENYPYTMDDEGEDENISVNLSSNNLTGDDSKLNASREAYARQFGQNLEKQMMPSYRDQVLDFLTAFGATGVAPGQYQTLADALSKTSKNFQSIFDPKVQAAKKAGTQGYLTALKGVDKERLLKYQKMAEDKARIEGIPYDQALKSVLARELGERDTSEKIIEDIAKQKMSQGGVSYPDARAEAEIEYKITRDPEYARQIKGRFKGAISSTRFMQDANGNYVLVNPQQKSTFRVNDVFVEPNTKKLFYFDGKKLVPLTK